ncbi:preprotein translocase subunit YajC [Curtobacterium sp. RRHDQ10]|uniref:preprotein translocase subunit YajC n=1 Tax=Curtobacterium phyllosphaerae TaxID=3413379 RepID=UPI003BF2023B
MQFNPTTIIMLLLLVGLVFLMVRNSRKRKNQQAELATKMIPGARVMLSFGIYGTLLSVNDEKVTADVEIAPGTVITVHRQTLSRVVEDDVDDVDTTPSDETTTPPMELNGEPVYGERIETTDDDASKRPGTNPDIR